MIRKYSSLLTILLLLSSATVSYGQKKTVKGKVKDATSGEALPGVNIQLKGTTTGTATDSKGNYSLKVSSSQDTLLFTYIGYQSRKTPIKGRTTINIAMRPTTIQGNQLVVTGYGRTRQQDITSSISSVKGSDLAASSVSNVANSLQGKVSGVQVVSNNGKPGSTPNIIIRGVTSARGTNPLVVVDGIPEPQGFSLQKLDQDNIKSIDILKDASAAAIYGSRASNGVIQVTTKSGQKGQATITINANYGLQHVNPIQVAGAREYAQGLNQAKLNDRPDVATPFPNAKSFGHGTDWWNTVIQSVAPTSNVNLGISGGSDDLTFYGNAGYYLQDAQSAAGSFQRVNARFKVNYDISDKVHFRQILSPQMVVEHDSPNLFRDALRIDPLTQPLLPDNEQVGKNRFSIYQRSKQTLVFNPAAIPVRTFGNNRTYRLSSNSQLIYDPISELRLKTQFGFSTSHYRRDNFSPKFKIDPLEQSSRSNVNRNFASRFDYVWNNTITYDKDIGSHSFKILGGLSLESYRHNTLSGTRYQLPANAGNAPNLRYLGLATGQQIQATDGESLTRFFSIFGRAKYNYNHKYFVTGSMRRDVSSKFPSDNKVAIFPSVSAAWEISNEKFFQNVPYVSFLKLKAGYGEVGNSNIPQEASLFTVTPGAYVFGAPEKKVTTAYLSRLGNDKLKWETVRTYNVGVDLKMFQNKLNLSVERYRRESINNLYPTTYPSYAGSPSSVYQNVGNFRSHGWDISAGYNGGTGDFSYDVGLTFSTNTSKAEKISPGKNQLLAGSGPGGNNIKITRVGQPLGSFYGLKSDGIFRSQNEINNYTTTDQSGRPKKIQPNAAPGDLKFKDVNGDGQITYADATVIGNPFPDFTSGLNFNLGYRRWSLRMQLYGTYGNDVYDKPKYYLTTIKNRLNFREGLLNQVWTPDNKDAKYARLTQTDPNGNFSRASNYFIENGSYLRMKLIKLGYDIPLQSLQQLRVYVSAQNLFTWTSYPGFDPEVKTSGGIINNYGIDNARYPQPKMFFIGVNLKI